MGELELSYRLLNYREQAGKSGKRRNERFVHYRASLAISVEVMRPQRIDTFYVCYY